MPPTYVRWDDPAVEPPIAAEEEKTEQLCHIINKCQSRNFTHHRHAFRGTHVKTQGIAKGTITTLPDLPAHLAQGVFRRPGTVREMAIRFANEPIFLQDDRAPGPRGCGMKIFGVTEGPWLDPVGEQTATQDFTFNNAPILELTDLPTCLDIFKLREQYFDDKDGLAEQLKQRKDSDLQFAPQSLPNHHFLAYTMYSQSAFRYGDYIAKFALFPSTDVQQRLAEQATINDSSSGDQHTQWLQDHFLQRDAEYDFKVQLCRNLDEQNVEDTSQEWDQENFPFETVAKIRLPAHQDVMAPERRAFWDDHMALNQWYGIEEHRPLGSVNRLRKAVYRASAMRREQINAVKIDLVKSVQDIP